MINTKRYPAGPASHIESHLYFPAAITNHGPNPPVGDLTGDLAYLRTLSFIVVIAAIVQLTELVIQKTSPLLHQVLGIYLPLITTNCAVLGVPLLNVGMKHNLLESLLFGFGSSLGFTLALVLFAGIRERLEGADVPLPFKGTAIAMITAGLMSLAFMGFAGLDRFH